MSMSNVILVSAHVSMCGYKITRKKDRKQEKLQKKCVICVGPKYNDVMIR